MRPQLRRAFIEVARDKLRERVSEAREVLARASKIATTSSPDWRYEVERALWRVREAQLELSEFLE